MSSWQSSNRRDRLPPDWHQIRRRIGKRDGWLCQWQLDGAVCGKAANQIDHVARGDDHSDRNLRCLCEYHHGIKSGREGAQASWSKRREIGQRLRRPEESHPGLL